MNVKKATFTEEEREEILREFSKRHPNHVYRRLLALKLRAINEMRSDEAGRISGVCHDSVNKVVNRYKAEGMKAIVGC